jgi:hypothetical protein
MPREHTLHQKEKIEFYETLCYREFFLWLTTPSIWVTQRVWYLVSQTLFAKGLI